MSAIWTLIRLQFNASVRLARDKSPLKTAIRWLIYASVGLVLLGVFVAVYYLLALQFVGGWRVGVDLRTQFLIFTIAIFMVIQLLFLVPMLIKVLDVNNDRERLLKLPVSSQQVFVSKIIVAYMFELVFAASILGPMLIAYGIAASMAFWFYLLIPVFILFVPIFPFFIAVLILFPIMKLAQFMKNRASLTTIVYLICLVAAVVVYMTIMQSMVKALADKGFAETIENNAGAIRNLTKHLYPASVFALMVSGGVGSFFMYLAIILVSSAAMFGLTFYIANLKYKKFYAVEYGAISSFKARGKYNGQNSTLAVLGKDTKNIFRSSNYTFQFLLIVVITPLLIYYSNRIAGYAVYQSFMNAGRPDMTFAMGFEVALFVVLTLIPLTSAFAASSITREGGNIYHTKLMPVSFRKQLSIKAGIVFVPIFISIFVGVMLTMIPHKITATHIVPGLSGAQIATILTLATFMAIGYISLGLYMDLRKPLCNQLGNGELTKSTSHVNFIILLGTIVGVLFGAIGMFSAFGLTIGLSLTDMQFRAILLALAITFGSVFATVLFVDGPKKYYKLEQ